MTDSELIRAAEAADWEQVRQNGGPPCFHIENGRFCLRAQRWDGHPFDHKYTTLAQALRAVGVKTEQRETTQEAK